MVRGLAARCFGIRTVRTPFLASAWAAPRNGTVSFRAHERVTIGPPELSAQLTAELRDPLRESATAAAR